MAQAASNKNSDEIAVANRILYLWGEVKSDEGVDNEEPVIVAPCELTEEEVEWVKDGVTHYYQMENNAGTLETESLMTKGLRRVQHQLKHVFGTHNVSDGVRDERWYLLGANQEQNDRDEVWGAAQSDSLRRPIRMRSENVKEAANDKPEKEKKIHFCAVVEEWDYSTGRVELAEMK